MLLESFLFSDLRVRLSPPSAIWNTYGANDNIGQLIGHSKPVTCLAFSPHSTETLFSGSADTTIIVWSLRTGEKVRRLRGHRAIVNTVACTRSGTEILVSGGDDGKVMLWDPREKHPLDVIDVGYPVTAVAFSDDASQVYVGGLDNDIHVSLPVCGGFNSSRSL